MRIISGLARGIRLVAPPGNGVRPTEDRVKESIFSTLGDLRGKIVLDLFSGSGALGLESLSRGAAHVVFVEQERRHMACIKQNYEAVKKSIGEECGECEFFCADVKQAYALVGHLAGKINILLADPPYETQPRGYGYAELVNDEKLRQLVAEDCILALEHASAKSLSWYPENKWELLKEKTYGIRAVSLQNLFLRTQIYDFRTKAE